LSQKHRVNYGAFSKFINNMTYITFHTGSDGIKIRDAGTVILEDFKSNFNVI